MNILIFDTETTSLDKPFCYNIGYVVKDTSNWEVLVERDFVVEQVWHNLPLFQSAYYASKRPLYVERMRSRKTTLDKFGYICAQMRRDIKTYNVEGAYAFNSDFDERVFEFNCDWFKVINPFENLPIFDIRGYAHQFLVNDHYKWWCDKHNAFTETGNYSTTAETLYRYMFDEEFVEEHTALSDSKIESDILRNCVMFGAKLNTAYETFRSIVRDTKKHLVITLPDNNRIETKYKSMRINRERTEIKLK